ncbi:MAG: biotin/lipoyl-containing protein [Oscillospiraceae bacterium]|nr:biotin/lipoyl-containing protein [Oscillospiraceae bacterium]
MKYRITLKGKTYEVEVERGEAMILDEYDAIAPAAPVPAPIAPAAAPPAAPAPAAPTAAGTVVTAPLPGNVLAINVKPGESVKAGQTLLLIEAMKMENEVVAPCDGVVKQLAVSKGALVATGDTLLVI